MKEFKGKSFYFIIIAILVFAMLFSNLGQNFKNDIISSNNIQNHINNFSEHWMDLKSYSEYIDYSSEYIKNFMIDYNMVPAYDNSFTEEWSSNLPSFKYPSSLEVLSGYGGKILKQYKYGKDFFEVFKGSIKADIVKDTAVYTHDINEIHKTSQILLYDGYTNKSSKEIEEIDSELKNIGITGVITPSKTKYLQQESGLYDYTENLSSNGLSKLLVTQSTFDELRGFSKKGYIIKMRSGGEIKPVALKNVYGMLKGKNYNYKPLTIVCFYDGIYNTAMSSTKDFVPYATTLSIVFDTIRALKTQRISNPDRTIIFAFISGYKHSKEGLEHFLKKQPAGDVIILDGLGINDSHLLQYTQSSKNFSQSAKYFLNENKLKIVSTSIYGNTLENFLYITANGNYEENNFDFQLAYKSGRFLLSLIGDECYNLDFLTGNSRQLRFLKRYIKEKSILISCVAIILLIVAIFRDSTKIYH